MEEAEWPAWRDQAGNRPPSERDWTDVIAFLWRLKGALDKRQSVLHFTDPLINTLEHT